MIIGFKAFRAGVEPPRKATEGASGYDLRACEDVLVHVGATALVPVGFGIAVPEGFEAQIRPRSSLSMRGLQCAFGTIDSDYRGEIFVCLLNRSGAAWQVSKGERIAQLVIAPVCGAVFDSEQWSETARGAGGFGSTGR